MSEQDNFDSTTANSINLQSKSYLEKSPQHTAIQKRRKRLAILLAGVAIVGTGWFGVDKLVSYQKTQQKIADNVAQIDSILAKEFPYLPAGMQVQPDGTNEAKYKIEIVDALANNQTIQFAFQSIPSGLLALSPEITRNTTISYSSNKPLNIGEPTQEKCLLNLGQVTSTAGLTNILREVGLQSYLSTVPCVGNSNSAK